jgi:hypothetical protein
VILYEGDNAFEGVQEFIFVFEVELLQNFFDEGVPGQRFLQDIDLFISLDGMPPMSLITKFSRRLDTCVSK